MKIKQTKTHPRLGKLNKFEDDNNALNGIFGSPFINFDLDVNFNLLDTEICLCLAKQKQIQFPKVSGVMPNDLKLGEFEDNILYDVVDNDLNLNILDDQERRRYLAYKHKSLIPWFNIVNIKPNKFKTKHLDITDWNPIINELPLLHRTILSLPFKEIGRVVIYQSWINSEVPCHRDSPSKDNFDHHINFNPGGYRPIYVYDPKNKSKHYLPKEYKFYAYNTTDFHGVDPLPHISYTVRVDGIYDNGVLKK